MDRVWNTLDGDQVVVSKAKTWESPVARAHGGRIGPTASGPGTSWARGHEGSYGSHPPVALPVPSSRAVTPRVPRGKGDGLEPIIVRRRKRSATPPKNVVRFGKASTFLTTTTPSSVGKADRDETYERAVHHSHRSIGGYAGAAGLAYGAAYAASPRRKLSRKLSRKTRGRLGGALLAASFGAGGYGAYHEAKGRPHERALIQRAWDR